MADNCWEVHKYMTKKADEIICSLNLNYCTNAIYDVLHQIIWHRGKDPVRWINENHDLVIQICAFNYISDLPLELMTKINVSLYAMHN